jgi:hypothetical protein
MPPRTWAPVPLRQGHRQVPVERPFDPAASTADQAVECHPIPKLHELTVDTSTSPRRFSAAICKLRRRSSGDVDGRPGGRCGLLQ